MQVEVVPAAREAPVTYRIGNIRIGVEVSFLGECLVDVRYVRLPRLSLLISESHRAGPAIRSFQNRQTCRDAVDVGQPAGAIPDLSDPEAFYCSCGLLRKLLRSAVLMRSHVSRPSRTMRIGTSEPAGPLAQSLR